MADRSPPSTSEFRIRFEEWSGEAELRPLHRTEVGVYPLRDDPVGEGRAHVEADSSVSSVVDRITGVLRACAGPARAAGGARERVGT